MCRIRVEVLRLVYREERRRMKFTESLWDAAIGCQGARLYIGLNGCTEFPNFGGESDFLCM